MTPHHKWSESLLSWTIWTYLIRHFPVAFPLVAIELKHTYLESTLHATYNEKPVQIPSFPLRHVHNYARPPYTYFDLSTRPFETSLPCQVEKLETTLLIHSHRNWSVHDGTWRGLFELRLQWADDHSHPLFVRDCHEFFLRAAVLYPHLLYPSLACWWSLKHLHAYLNHCSCSYYALMFQ